MTLQINVDKGIRNGEKIEIYIENEELIESITPAGKMITDSQQKSFVYLIDGEDEYGQLHFFKSVWPLLKEALQTEKNPILVCRGKEVELDHFVDELEMLIENIAGNSNYGAAFVQAVEAHFESIIQPVE